MIDILKSIEYVVSVPYFWPTMGSVTAISIFIGSMIFDGHTRDSLKALIAILVYAAFLFFVQINRILYYSQNSDSIKYTYMSYAQSVTLVFITFFWILGVILGTVTTRLVHHYKSYHFI